MNRLSASATPKIGFSNPIFRNILLTFSPDLRDKARDNYKFYATFDVDIFWQGNKEIFGFCCCQRVTGRKVIGQLARRGVFIAGKRCCCASALSDPVGFRSAF